MDVKPDRIRFDDCLWKSSDAKMKGKELQKFTKNVMWCKNTGVLLTPAILCKDIEMFPDCVSWVREQTQEGLIYPDLHGFDHGPYASRSQLEIEEHLSRAQEWFKANLKVPAVRWVTPHGANSPAMQAAASKYDLVIETTEPPVVDQKALDTRLRETGDLSLMRGRVVMNHYWERGLRLYRIARIIEYQGVHEAIEATRVELNVKDHNICWNKWPQ